MASATATTIAAACACTSFHTTIALETSLLPILVTICLCNTCRRLSGTCGTSYAGTVQIADPAALNLTTYKASDGTVHCFCSTCGAQALVQADENGTWRVATGLWECTEGITVFKGCESVAETLDGGISVWLGATEGASKERFSLPTRHNHDTGKERLKASCDCGGVQFYLTRPNAESLKASSPFSDLIVPFHTGASSDNPQNEPWWLRAGNTKYMAGTCMCRSCRVALGFEIQTWAFVPKSNIVQEDGPALDYGMGTLKRYHSADDVEREFCGVCGATVFWHCGWRPSIVDVSIGLLDPEEGARAENWLEWWTDRVSFQELAENRSLVGRLEDGLKRWAKGEVV
jgi:hypothetical protein